MGRRTAVSLVAGVVLLVPALTGVGCGPPPAPPPAPPPPVVTVVKPGSIPVQRYYEYNGYLDAVETVEIRARVKGFLDDVMFTEGEEVKAQAPLYKIDPREYNSAVARSKSEIARAVADQANATAQVQLAEAELSRLRGVGSSVSRSELDKAAATLAANKAQADVAVANKGSAEAALRTAELQLSYTDIKSPIAGRISRTLVTRGNLVGQTDTLLTTIVSVEELFVYFDVPEKDLVEYQKALSGKTPTVGANGSVPVQVGVATEDGYPHVGKIDFRENRVDTGTGTVRLRGRMPNPLVPPGNARLLYPGLFARVRVPVGSDDPQPVIPEDALMTDQEGRFVYVWKDGKVNKQLVKVGVTVWRAPPAEDKAAPRWQLTTDKPDKDGKVPKPVAVRSMVAIERGLTADDVVIVSGLQKTRIGGVVTPDDRKLEAPLPK